MEYGSELQRHVIEKFSEKWPDSQCPICHESAWGVQREAFFFMAKARTPTSASSGHGMPCAALVCQVCGNTQFINLLVLDPDFNWSEWF